MILFPITAAGLIAGNTGIIVMSSLSSLVPGNGPALSAVTSLIFGHPRASGNLAFHSAGAVIIASPVIPATVVVIAGTSSTAAAATILTASEGQQQQDNQTIHTLCFLSAFVTLSYAEYPLM